MTDQFTLVNSRKGNEREFDTRADAEEQRDKLIGLGMRAENLEIRPPGDSDGGRVESEIVETTSDDIAGMDKDGKPKETRATHPEKFDNGQQGGESESGVVSAPNELPDEQPGVDTDPLEWMPSHFIDEIQGVPTVNRMGYAVIASKYNVSVTAEPVTLASETNFEYAEFQATAVTESGEEYSGFGSAHVDRGDGDDPELLNELSETRALKRACTWATGVGLTAVEELKSEL